MPNDSERDLAATPSTSGRPEPPASLVPPSDPSSAPGEGAPRGLGLVGEPRPDTPPVGAAASRIPPAPITRSLPPLPDVEPILDEAARLRERQDWDGALEAYKKALFILSKEEPSTQRSVYAWIAEVKLAQGKAREAETNFEKALALDPKHLRSLAGLVALATAEEDWARAASARRRRAAVVEDDDEAATELCLVAEIEEKRLGNLDAALAALEGARRHRPDDVGVLLKLRDVYMHRRAWPSVMQTLDALVRASTDPRQRGAFRLAQAEIALGRLGEEPRGLAFLELALDEDPACDRALSALVALRSRREEWAELAAVYESLLDRYAGLVDRERAWEVCRRLGTLRRDRLHEGPGAIEALRAALELRPEDAETRAALAELYVAKGERTSAVRELEATLAHAPLRAQTYRRLFELHQRAGRPDRAWLTVTCLEELGATDVSHELAVEQFRPEGAIRPTAALAEAWWGELLAADGADPLVDELLVTIGDAAIALRLEELEAKRRLPSLDPARRQEKASTVSAVRTFVWAARALGVTAPDLYILDVVPTGIAAAPARAPSVALGPAALSGRTVQELAFLAGRHLTYYRPAHYPLVFFPTLADVSSLVLSSLRLVIPSVSVPPPPDAESRVGERLGAGLGPEQRSRLEELVARLDARGGRLDLLAWIRSVELTAARAGLLLAGDLRTAMRATKDEQRAIGELSREDRRGDLLAYCASERYGVLRERMGVRSGTGLRSG